MSEPEARAKGIHPGELWWCRYIFAKDFGLTWMVRLATRLLSYAFGKEHNASTYAMHFFRRIVMLLLYQALKVERCTIGFRRLWYIAHSGMFRYFLR